MPKISKAVFPVAGMGTRFLPATKASPKEMMPVVDKPLIQYAVEEAIAAGITELIFITGRHKRAIEDHFDKAYEMEAELEARGKNETLEMLRSILPKHVSCIYIRQSEALGLGHAILCARPAVGNEPFAVLLADDLLVGDEPIMGQLCRVYEQNGCSILAVQNVEAEDTVNYGIVKCGPGMSGLHPITGIVEKPEPENAPSTLGVVGRYILTPKVFEHLEKVKPGAGGEIQLTDGIASLLLEERALAYEFSGTRYDCGSKIGYLKATIALALEHPEVGREFAEYLDAIGCHIPSSPSRS
ncbi:UTP--glucose-1-phosphate uridylyltransferase GalU [Nitrosospira briensis]|uniref:UTP--glucose-1-phosphate uridylyltransferase GalU n=1 Tax=Nitrosospira briensis TaxID=35799 RepID=UPI0008F2B17C|nr:UTP--glucose-1-phosphate uridylyltransferase GalU [Nitrosospira briensis]SFO04295.1 UDP-glucose pyrophosphorylase [Nitrosospira briensis]